MWRFLIGALLVVVVLVGLVVDHRIREAESRRVSSCARAAAEAVHFSSARVDAIVDYVRPTLAAGLAEPVRRRLLRIVSTSVAPTITDVEDASRLCSRVRVLSLHSRLRGVRADCLRLLRRDLAYLREVVADGARAELSRSLPAGSCHAGGG